MFRALAFLAFSVCLSQAHAGTRIEYKCDRLGDTVFVDYDGFIAKALYGIPTEGDEAGDDVENAIEYVKLFKLKVLGGRERIQFEVTNDFGSGLINCARLR